MIVESGFSLYDYTKQDVDDPRVTQGDGAAWIEVDNGGWTTAAVLELSQSDVLNEVLATVPAEDRVHYTLSYDFILIPDPSTAVSWFQTIPSVTGSRLSPNWAGEMVQRTTSINLGSVEWESPAPNINLVTQGGSEVASGISASGASTSWQDTISGTQKFYRVRRDQ